MRPKLIRTRWEGPAYGQCVVEGCSSAWVPGSGFCERHLQMARKVIKEPTQNEKEQEK